MMSRPTGGISYGLIGAGAIAQAYLQVLQQSTRDRLAAVADLQRGAADAVAELAGCPSFGSHWELAAESDCDAVIICTPPATHPEMATYFLERGIAVLCEKPLAIDSASARRMIAAAESSGIHLSMASKFRYVEDVLRARLIINSGVLGEPVLFENTFTGRVDMSHRWNSDPAVSGGGVLIDNGTHSVDIMRYFLGPLAELQVVEGKRLQQLAVEDTVRIALRTSGGVMGHIDLSWALHKEQPHYISIYCSEGTLHVGWKESRYRRHQDEQWTIFGDGYSKQQAFASQIDNFSAALRGEEALRISLEDALASVVAIETAYQALEQSDWLSLPAVT